MNLTESKVVELIGKMNSVSGSAIPPQPPILEMFNIAMDEKMLDYLLAVGTAEELKQRAGVSDFESAFVAIVKEAAV